MEAALDLTNIIETEDVKEVLVKNRFDDDYLTKLGK
jgi:hypothetical protein